MPPNTTPPQPPRPPPPPWTFYMDGFFEKTHPKSFMTSGPSVVYKWSNNFSDMKLSHYLTARSYDKWFRQLKINTWWESLHKLLATFTQAGIFAHRLTTAINPSLWGPDFGHKKYHVSQWHDSSWEISVAVLVNSSENIVRHLRQCLLMQNVIKSGKVKLVLRSHKRACSTMQSVDYKTSFSWNISWINSPHWMLMETLECSNIIESRG